MFLPTVFLHTLLIVRRDIVKKPMIVNNHRVGGNFTQRGMRCNMCQLVRTKHRAYLSAHVTGMGLDFHCNGISAEEIRQLINKNSYLLPYPIRLESDVNWVHLDTYDPTNGSYKVSFFNG